MRKLSYRYLTRFKGDRAKVTAIASLVVSFLSLGAVWVAIMYLRLLRTTYDYNLKGGFPETEGTSLVLAISKLLTGALVVFWIFFLRKDTVVTIAVLNGLVVLIIACLWLAAFATQFIMVLPVLPR